LDEDSLQDLRLKLSSDVQQIIEQYSSYVSYIRECLQENGVSAKDLSSYLMTMSAFSRSEQKPKK
jgi:stage III sporulation protein SpoIIIAA